LADSKSNLALAVIKDKLLSFASSSSNSSSS